MIKRGPVQLVFAIYFDDQFISPPYGIAFPIADSLMWHHCNTILISQWPNSYSLIYSKRFRFKCFVRGGGVVLAIKILNNELNILTTFPKYRIIQE